jgi:hypothetical protein
MDEAKTGIWENPRLVYINTVADIFAHSFDKISSKLWHISIFWVASIYTVSIWRQRGGGAPLIDVYSTCNEIVGMISSNLMLEDM